jgi:hypothetical protein
MPLSSNPLAASRRFGVVADIPSPPNTVGVNIGGDNAGNDWDSGEIRYCSYLSSYQPQLNDQVMLIGITGDWTIVGSLGLGVPKVTGHALVSVSPGDITSGSAVDIGTCPAISVPPWARDGTHSIFVKATANPAIITSSGTFPFRVVDGTTVANEDPLSTTQIEGAASTEFTIFSAGTFAIPNGSTQRTVIKVQAWRTAGTGAVRYNSTAGNVSTTLMFEWEIT